jgi:hypothetical protein
MPPAAPAFTYRLAFRPVDDQMTSAELARTVLRALLALNAAPHRVSIQTIQRPPGQDASGLYVDVVASGKEHWYLEADDYLLSEGLRGELQP